MKVEKPTHLRIKPELQLIRECLHLSCHRCIDLLFFCFSRLSNKAFLQQKRIVLVLNSNIE